MNNSLYETLGVEKNACEAEIKKAYRKKARETHPDLNGGSDSAFKETALAYRILSNDTKRKEYDATGHYDDGVKLSRLKSELVRLFVETVTSGCDINYTDIFKLMANKIKSDREKTRIRLDDFKLLIADCKNMIRRIESKDKLFVAVLHCKINDAKKAMGVEQEILSSVPLMLDILKKYKYRVDSQDFATESVSFTDSVAYYSE